MPDPDKPPKVALNLDQLEREGDRPEPFVVSVGGHPIVFADPFDIEWDDLLAVMSDPRRFLTVAVPDVDDRKRLAAGGLPAWKLRRLSQAWQQHYRLNLADVAGPPT